MTVTASALRQNIYRLLDRVLETGQPLEVRRGDRMLRIVAEKPASKLARLSKRKCIRGNPEDLVHLDWSKEWKP
jgi:antitoxin (DNA-binding transcriptional repressor) of toxin-antitoxin stability system